jgi:hypothetical protein
MSFFLFSRSQKRDTNPNKKFFNLNNKIIIKESNYNKRKNILIKNEFTNKNICSNKKKIDYNHNQILNSQVHVKKNEINSYIENKQDLMEVLSNMSMSISDFSLKKDNSNYNESLDNKEKYIQNIEYLKYDNVLDGLFGNFFLLSSNKDTNVFLIKDKEFLLSKLNKIINLKRYKNIPPNINVIKNININSSNNFNLNYINKNFANSKLL